MNNNDIIQEIIKLKKEVNRIKAALFDDRSNKALHPFSTTKEERRKMSAHIEELDREIKNKKCIKKAPKLTNKLKIGQFVRMNDNRVGFIKGRIVYIACDGALPSKKECDKEKCPCKIKNYVWVYWENKKIIAYHFDKLKVIDEEYLKPYIGKELSGRIGSWVYNKDTKIWKRDGDEKLYTEEEFADFMYYEEYPEAKEDGKNLIKALMDRKKKE